MFQSSMLVCLVLMACPASIRADKPINQGVRAAPVITFDRLLDEMCDADALARFPEPAYRQMQASSYNRKSVSRDQPEQDTRGWFADSDGISWIREEIINGRKEWVIMEHDGPGCLTKFWTPFFYYGFGNRVGPRIRIYLDGSTTPVIDETFIELLTRNDWPNGYGSRPPRRNSFQIPSPFADFTARAGDLYLPIPFAESCKVTLDDKAFYNIVNYRAYPSGTLVCSFNMDQYYGWAGGVNPTKQDEFDHPFLANISVGSTAHDSTLGFNICNRIRGLDAVPLNSRLRFDMEASPGTGQRNPWNLLGYSAVTWWYALPGATCNRPALPGDAVKPLPSLDRLQKQSDQLRPDRQPVPQLEGAIECERLKPTAVSTDVNIHAQIPAPNFNPRQLSGGELR